jgi:hypothetical protein
MQRAACLLILAAVWLPAADVSGELKRWHRVTLTLEGPATSETAAPNPFRDYRFDVLFVHEGSREQRRVPGFFAADGNAAETGAEAGNRWRVHFLPTREGQWRWRASFRQGPDVAIDERPLAGRPVAGIDGQEGEFTIAASDKQAPDFRARGLLEARGERYYRFAGDGGRFLKGGVDSPETLLGYADFDGTWRETGEAPQGVMPAPDPVIPLPALREGLHHYEPHLRDWRPGDPTWRGGKGKGLIGGLNYLASQGVNSIYFLTMNTNGDGRNVWPWTGPWTFDRFDVSKLDQWEIVFSHAQRLGLLLHVVTQETENDHMLDKGKLRLYRNLYYRELIARFAHHPALQWNLGEENMNTAWWQKEFAQFFLRHDPYRHPVVLHNDHRHDSNLEETFGPLLGHPAFAGTSFQIFQWPRIPPTVRRYVRASAEAGHPWVVMMDEMGGANFGLRTDAEDPDHDEPRRYGLWGSLLNGGAGVEWYFGWQNNSPHSDLSAEDWRVRENMYRQTKIALDFFHRELPFWRMQPAAELTGGTVETLAEPGVVYCLYVPEGVEAALNLETHRGPFRLRWFDPKTGRYAENQAVVEGPGSVKLPAPPAKGDWVALLR